jgi:hypothetical protein
MALIEEDRDGGIRLARRPERSGFGFKANPLGSRAGEITPLYANFDTLVLWFKRDRPWIQALIRELQTKKIAAEESVQLFSVGPYTFEVMANGARGGFSFVLQSPVCTILIQKGGGAQISIRAVLLAAMGSDAAVDDMVAIVGELRSKGHFGETTAPMPQISRADVCVDLPIPVFTMADVENMVTRARLRTAYGFVLQNGARITQDQIERAMNAIGGIDVGSCKVAAAHKLMKAIGFGRVWTTENGEIAIEHAREAVFCRGTDPSGVSIGKNQLMFRGYDKILESRIKGNAWIRAIYKGQGWTGGPVTRLEFQLRKGGLDTFDPIRRGARRWDVVRDRVGDLWEYLTREWLTVRRPTENTQRARWPVDPRWAAVQAVRFNGLGPMRRADLGKPPRWFVEMVQDEKNNPDRLLTVQDFRTDGTRARGRVETRRRGVHRPGHRILDVGETDKLARLKAQAQGSLISMAALIGGESPFRSALAMCEGADEFARKFEIAEARHIYRGAARLEF